MNNSKKSGGHFLCSGRLRDFHIEGELGQSTYEIAQTLREAIRRSAKNDSLHLELFLAIPKENRDRLTVDWYADDSLNSTDSLNTSVINWSQATPEEQNTARQKLLFFQENVQALSTKLLERSNQSSSAHSAHNDLHTFAHILPKVLITPSQLQEVSENGVRAFKVDPSYVFLVGAEQQPVLTFWGFSQPGQSHQDPFHFLHPVSSPTPARVTPRPVEAAPPPPVAPPIVNTPIEVPAKRSSWWRWLLLALLLLLLCLFVWRSCTPQVPLTTPSIANAPNATSKNFAWPSWLPSIPSLGLGRPSIPEGIALPNISLPDMALPELSGVASLPNLPSGSLPNLTAPELSGLTALPELALDPAQTEPAMQATPPSSPTPPLTAEPTALAAPPGTPPSLQLGPELQIPNTPSAGTIPSYMNGDWLVHALQDKRTGQPVRLEYAIENGAGQVKVHKGGNVTCLGGVQAISQGVNLDISSTDQAICDDGSSYEMPDVTCSLDEQQKTTCLGRYDNQLFPISMRHASN